MLKIKYSLNLLLITTTRNFGTSNCLSARRPPKEEYENNQLHTRKRTADPFDRLLFLLLLLLLVNVNIKK